MANHVYYSRYLDMLEEARGEFFRELGTTFLDWQKVDTAFPVIDCHISYKEAAQYDDVLNIKLWVTMACKVRLNFSYEVFGKGGALLLEAETKHVCTSAAGKPKRLPPDLVVNLGPFIANRD